MEELGDGFSFVFVVCGVFGCCLTHVLELDVVTVFGRSFVGICEFEMKTFYLEKLEERF